MSSNVGVVKAASVMASGGKGSAPRPPNGPSTSGNPSGGGRGNNPPSSPPKK